MKIKLQTYYTTEAGQVKKRDLKGFKALEAKLTERYNNDERLEKVGQQVGGMTILKKDSDNNFIYFIVEVGSEKLH